MTTTDLALVLSKLKGPERDAVTTFLDWRKAARKAEAFADDQIVALLHTMVREIGRLREDNDRLVEHLNAAISVNGETPYEGTPDTGGKRLVRLVIEADYYTSAAHTGLRAKVLERMKWSFPKNFARARVVSTTVIDDPTEPEPPGTPASEWRSPETIPGPETRVG